MIITQRGIDILYGAYNVPEGLNYKNKIVRGTVIIKK